MSYCSPGRFRLGLLKPLPWSFTAARDAKVLRRSTQQTIRAVIGPAKTPARLHRAGERAHCSSELLRSPRDT